MKPLFTLVILFGVLALNAKHKLVTLETAAKSKILKFNIKGTGTYNGDCLVLQAENLQNDSVIIFLEAGRRLDSKTNDEQDILVMKDQFFILKSYQKKDFKINGFCCQANNHIPKNQSSFGIGKTADKDLLAVAQFCNQHTYTQSTIQSAVWCVSNRRPIASIPELQDELRRYVSSITGEEIPWYEITYENAASNSIISETIDRISGNINYNLPASSKLKIELRDSKDRIIMDFECEKSLAAGNHDYWFDMQVSHYPKGKYYISLYSNSTVVAKKQFVI